MSIINPLTLLVIPLIGSFIILSYPFSGAVISAKGSGVPGITKAPFLPLAQHSGPSTGKEAQSRDESSIQCPSLKELIEKPVTAKNNSNIKKIAIITSLINFIVSVIL
jgi:hypothetical protein